MALWLAFLFVALGPTASIRPCPVHMGGHGRGGMDSHAGHAGHHGGAARTGGRDGGDRSHDSGPSVPCDCLGMCLTCCVALPNATARANLAGGRLVPIPVPIVHSLVRGNPAPYLTPLAKPPPA